jgi:hypothetical protein
MKRWRQWVTAYISDWKIAAIASVIGLISFLDYWGLRLSSCALCLSITLAFGSLGNED